MEIECREVKYYILIKLEKRVVEKNYLYICLFLILLRIDRNFYIIFYLK